MKRNSVLPCPVAQAMESRYYGQDVKPSVSEGHSGKHIVGAHEKSIQKSIVHHVQRGKADA